MSRLSFMEKLLDGVSKTGHSLLRHSAYNRGIHMGLEGF
jgi:hypothetical protein